MLTLTLLVPTTSMAQEVLDWDNTNHTFVQPNEATLSEMGEAMPYSQNSLTYNANATNTNIDRFIKVSKDLINWSSGIILIIITVYVVIYGVQLASAGDNPSQRKEILARLMYCGIALMVLGGRWTIGLLAASLF